MVCALAACLAGGCAAGVALSGAARPDHDASGPRQMEASDTPAPTVALAQTLESWDPQLSAALVALAVDQTADRHYRVALEYRRLGVLDDAYAHLQQAVAMAPEYAPAYDALARIWRDWGFASQGIADAYRAVYFAPRSAAAANTLGMLFQAVGRLPDARRWYERSVVLDPRALYALNNLCYLTIMQRDAGALGACERARAAAPASGTARNNLALAYAARGDLARARQTFLGANDPAIAEYNMGIVYLGARAYEQAAGAFARALAENPRFTLAAARARQARADATAREPVR